MATLSQLAGKALSIQIQIVADIAQDQTLFDLSEAGATYIGRQPTYPRLPFVQVDLLGITSEDDTAPLGYFEKTATFFIEGWCAIPNDRTSSAASYGQALAGWCAKAVQDSHQTSGGGLKALGTRRVNMSEIEFLNTEQPGQKVGHFRGTLEVVYTVAAGGTSGI